MFWGFWGSNITIDYNLKLRYLRALGFRSCCGRTKSFLDRIALFKPFQTFKSFITFRQGWTAIQESIFVASEELP
jgi:hypothetical protein